MKGPHFRRGIKMDEYFCGGSFNRIGLAPFVIEGDRRFVHLQQLYLFEIGVSNTAAIVSGFRLDVDKEGGAVI